jgi:hypothetical protein
MVKYLKWIFLSCFAISGILLFSFKETIFISLVSQVVDYYSYATWGESLHYDQILLNPHQILITYPRLKNQNLQAKELKINFFPKILNLELDIIYFLEQPSWHLHPTTTKIGEKLVKTIQSKSSFFKISPTFIIQGGQLSWLSSDQIPQLATIDAIFNQLTGGTLCLYFDPATPEHNFLALQAKSQADHLRIKGECHQVDIKSLLDIFHWFTPYPTAWKVQSGTLEGVFKTNFPMQEPEFLEGELLAESLTLTHEHGALCAQFPLVQLSLDIQQSDVKTSHEASLMKGQLQILNPARLTCQLLDQEIRCLEDITGYIQLDQENAGQIFLEAQNTIKQQLSKWNLQGKFLLNLEKLLQLDLALQSQSKHQSASEVHLSYHEMPTMSEAKLTVKDFSASNCCLFYPLLTTYWPDSKNFRLEAGTINACLNLKANEWSIKQFNYSKGKGFLIPGHLDFSFDQLQIEEDTEAQTQWTVLNGTLCHKEFSFLPLTVIQAHMQTQLGKIDHSHVHLQIAGLEGNLALTGEIVDPLLSFELNGSLANLIRSLSFELPVDSSFDQEKLTMTGCLKSIDNCLELEGTCDLESMPAIHFGGELTKTEDKQKIAWSPHGWFYAHQLPLKKFISPFMFQQALLEGLGNIKGILDQDWLTIQYETDQMKIENDYFLIESPPLHSTIPGQLIGNYQMHWTRDFHQGKLPIHHVTYLEKNSGLLIENIQGVVQFENHLITIPFLEAEAHGISFEGALKLDNRDPRPSIFDLSIQLPRFSGHISNIKSFLKHFNSLKIAQDLFVDGEVMQRAQGVQLDFHFMPVDYLFQASIEGMIINGTIPFKAVEIALKGLDMDFSYQQDQKLLNFSSIHGTLVVGKTDEAKEYDLTGEQISIQGRNSEIIQVDLCAHDQQTEIARLVAYLTEDEQQIRHLYLDPQLSHLGVFYPQQWNCCLKKDFALDHLQWHTTFAIEKGLQNVQQFSEGGIGFLSAAMVRQLTYLSSLQGLVDLTLTYQSLDDQIFFQMDSNEIHEGELLHQLALKGGKQGKKWTIDHLKWDDFHLYTELHQEEKEWLIPFLGLEKGSSLLLGMEGKFLSEVAQLKGQINLCKIDLKHLQEWKIGQAFAHQWQPQGMIEATGDFIIHSTPYQIEATIQAVFSQLTVQGQSLKIPSPIQCSLKNQQFVLNVPKGRYFFRNQFYNLQPCQLELADHQLKFDTSCEWNQLKIRCRGQTVWPNCEIGRCLLDDQMSSFPLTIQWGTHEKNGWFIESAQGEFGCYSIQLQHNITSDPLQPNALKGEITMHSKKLQNDIPVALKQIFKDLKIDAVFKFLGQFWIKPELGSKLSEILFFKGLLTSSLPKIQDLQFKQLNANCCYSPQQFEIKDFILKNQADSLQMPFVMAHYHPQEKRWKIFIPSLIGRYLRPFLCSHPSNPAHGLMIKRLELKNIQGDLHQLASWQGEGSLHFVNPIRQKEAPLLFTMPADPLAHLNLEAKVLSPVTGTVLFQMKESRLYLTRFKDVFSEGRSSRFYLADSSTPSWIDAKGNLSLHLRMKQYNFIFKIAELFTMSIEGNLKKPHYRLQKQAKNLRKKKGINPDSFKISCNKSRTLSI